MTRRERARRLVGQLVLEPMPSHPGQQAIFLERLRARVEAALHAEELDTLTRERAGRDTLVVADLRATAARLYAKAGFSTEAHSLMCHAREIERQRDKRLRRLGPLSAFFFWLGL